MAWFNTWKPYWIHAYSHQQKSIGLLSMIVDSGRQGQPSEPPEEAIWNNPFSRCLIHGAIMILNGLERLKRMLRPVMSGYSVFLILLFASQRPCMAQNDYRDANQTNHSPITSRNTSVATELDLDLDIDQPQTLPLGLIGKVSILFDFKKNQITLVGSKHDLAIVRRTILLHNESLKRNPSVITARVKLENQLADQVVTIMENLSQSSSNQPRLLSIAAIHFPESVLLTGSKINVSRAQAMIKKIDSAETK
ncbi:MAG: hypothetical protein ACI814_002579 [Mariniblastus sp.]